jgi:hypothetical protein
VEILLRNLLLKFKIEKKGAPILEYVILLCIAAFIAAMLFPDLRIKLGEINNEMTEKISIGIGGSLVASPGVPENPTPPVFIAPDTLELTIAINAPTVINTYTPIKFSANATGGTGPYTMAWTSYNGKNDGTEGPGQTYPVGTNIIEVEVTDSTGNKKIVEKQFIVEEGYFTYTEVGQNATITNYTGNNFGIYDVVIPGEIGGKIVNRIGIFAFDYKDITSVVLPDSVTSFDNYAFRGNKLTTFDLPDTLVKIPRGIFHFNDLATIEIPSSVTTIEYDAFSQNNLTSVIIPDSVTTMGAWAFEFNQLQDVTISKNLTAIPQGAFYNNKLTSVNIPGGVVGAIGADAFSYNDLTSIIVPSSVNTVGARAFGYNDLTSATFLNNSVVLASGVFYNNLGIPSNLTLKGGNPSTAKNYAASIGYNFLQVQ